MATLKERFIELLEQDIVQFEEIAKRLESLIPYIANPSEQEGARAEVRLRRGRAEELRQLRELVKLEKS